jgi:hypothetical protein
MKRITTAVVVGLALLVVPASALAAGSSTCQAYNAQTCNVSALTQSRTEPVSTVASTTTATTAASSSSLPFTGLDVGLLAVGGVVLVGSGLLVRRASSRLN